MINEQSYVERESSSAELPGIESNVPVIPSLNSTVENTIPPIPSSDKKRQTIKAKVKKEPEVLEEVSKTVVNTKRVRIKKPVAEIAPAVVSGGEQVGEAAPAKKMGLPATPKVKKITTKVTTKAPAKKSDSRKNVITATFQLRFSTKYGQSLFITGNHELFGHNDITKAVPLNYYNDECWSAVINIPKNADAITYRYILRGEDGIDTVEWGNDKTITPSQIKAGEVVLIDSWNYPGYYENVFYTEPFKEVLFKQNPAPPKTFQPALYTHIFKVKAPLLTNNQVLCISGNIPQLGGWNKPGDFIMNRLPGQDWWTLSIDLSSAQFPVAYKYGVYNVTDKLLAQFESGNNRVLQASPAAESVTIVTDGFISLPNNTFKAAGVAVPVFSLKSRSNLGIGEFNDLKLSVDWAKKTGLKLVQVLPVNDTTATHSISDSYPYAAISAFALHPAYLHLPAIITKKNKAQLDLLQQKQAALSKSTVVDYDGVVKAKFDFIRQVFPSQKVQTFKKEDFRAFFHTNEHWLVPYAAFCYFRDQFGTADFSKWPSNNVYDAAEINSLAGSPLKANHEVSIHYFIQYHLHLQLTEATKYAHENGIILKGDIPIGIYRNSCDAWQQPWLYNMDQQAGAPPDDFAVKGQNWGFPTYNWQKMAEDGFSWWKNRFEQMSYYFDAFRIDHILGFFRIWSIPIDAVDGIMGHFVPALPVHINEFNENQVWFDHKRYTKPFINDEILYSLFGNDKDKVAAEFLQSLDGNHYELLPAFDTQRKMEDHFAKVGDNEHNQKIKQGLFDLISNVILFEEPGSGGTQFHFRIAVENTSSFQLLEGGTKEKIKSLYINYFYHRQDNFWMREAMAKLPELKQSTNMLIFGEDLGMVPQSVPGVMKNLGILSLEIQRMPKNSAREFFHPSDAPYLSVVTPSTHDMSTIRGWWQENQHTTQRFYNRELGQYGKAPLTCEPWINKTIVLQHLHSPAMWSVFQLQDLLGMSSELRREDPNEERINIPANSKHYWVYKMHLNLEDLLHQDQFNARLKEHVSAAGR